MLFESVEEGEEAVKEQARDKKRDTKTGRVDGKQEKTAPCIVCRPRGQRKDRPENRADTGGPAGGKGDANNKGSKEPTRFGVKMHTLLAEKHPEVKDPGQMQAEEEN